MICASATSPAVEILDRPVRAMMWWLIDMKPFRVGQTLNFQAFSVKDVSKDFGGWGWGSCILENNYTRRCLHGETITFLVDCCSALDSKTNNNDAPSPAHRKMSDMLRSSFSIFNFKYRPLWLCKALEDAVTYRTGLTQTVNRRTKMIFFDALRFCLYHWFIGNRFSIRMWDEGWIKNMVKGVHGMGFATGCRLVLLAQWWCPGAPTSLWFMSLHEVPIWFPLIPSPTSCQFGLTDIIAYYSHFVSLLLTAPLGVVGRAFNPSFYFAPWLTRGLLAPPDSVGSLV
jgi:hypothetical protein